MMESVDEPTTQEEEAPRGYVATQPRVVKSWPEVRYSLVGDLEHAMTLNTAGQHEEVNAVLTGALTLLRTVLLRSPTPYPGISPSIYSEHASDVASEASYHSDTLPPPPPWNYQFRDYEPATPTSTYADEGRVVLDPYGNPYSPESPNYDLPENAHLSPFRPRTPDYEVLEDVDNSDPVSDGESNPRRDIEE